MFFFSPERVFISIWDQVSPSSGFEVLQANEVIQMRTVKPGLLLVHLYSLGVALESAQSAGYLY